MLTYVPVRSRDDAADCASWEVRGRSPELSGHTGTEIIYNQTFKRFLQKTADVYMYSYVSLLHCGDISFDILSATTDIYRR